MSIGPMDMSPQAPLASDTGGWQRLLAAMVIALGLSVLAGWAWDIETLKRVLPAMNTMKVNTAIGFILVGTGLLLQSLGRASWMARGVQLAVAALAMLLGLLTLSEYLFDWNPGLDELFFQESTGRIYSASPGRMSALTSTCFALLGLALAFAAARRGWTLIQTVAMLVGAISLLALGGNMFGDPSFPNLPRAGAIAIHTAVAFLLVSIGLLLSTRRHGVLVRWQAHYLNIGFGSALVVLVVAGIAVYVGIERQQEAARSVEHHYDMLLQIQAASSQLTQPTPAAMEQFMAALIELRSMQRQEDGLEQHLAALDLAARRLMASPIQDKTKWDALVTEIDSRLLKSREEQGSLLKKRQKAIQITNSASIIALTIALALILALLLMTFPALQREISRRKRTEQELAHHRDQLEIKMADLAENNQRLNAEITQRRAAEGERDRLASIMEATTDIVSMADPQGNVTYFNRAGRSMLGKKANTESGTVIAQVHPQWAADLILKEGVPTAIREGTWLGETAILAPEGREVPVSQVILSHKDAEGNLLYLSTIMRDISERKRAEEALRSSEEKLRTMFEFSPLGIILNAMDGRFVEANPAMLRMVGYTLEELNALSYWDLTPVKYEQDEARQLESLATTARYGPYEKEYIRKDGSLVPINLNGVLITGSDGKQYIWSTIEDITERKHAEEAMRISEERLRQAIRVSRIGIFDHDHLTGQAYWSPEQRDIFGWNAGESRDLQGFLAIVHPDDIEAVVVAVRRSHDPAGDGEYEMTYRVLRGQGDVAWIETRGQTFFEGEGSARRSVRTVGATVDITERKNAEEALKHLNDELEDRVEQRTAELAAAKVEAERASLAKSEFLSSMSHELRTPLNAILGFGQLLQMEVKAGEQADNVKEILHAGKHLLELINEVLDLARIEAGRLTISQEPVPLVPLIEDCLTLIRPLAEARGIRIVEGGRDCAEHVRADRVRLKQVLLNLLSNAVKYNREGGSLSIVCVDESNAIQVRVSDTGAGLTPEQQARLFTAFERLDADKTTIEGTGIGLALCKRLVELMGGQIGVESTPGQGSTFWVRLPATDGHPEPVQRTGQASMPEAAATVGRQRHDVLCIEDNPANMRLIERILGRRDDIRLLTAPVPGLGLELAAAHRPALILLDINLPDMDGYEVMQCLRENPATRHIPVVAISANAMPKDLARGKAAGFADYITKPVDVDRLLQAVDAIVCKLET